MAAALKYLPYYRKFQSRFKGAAPAVYAVAIVAVMFILWQIYLLMQKAIKAIEARRDEKNIGEVAESAISDPADGVIPDVDEVEAFRPQAKIIADQQETAMQEAGTDETALFEPLVPLNGWQLAVIFEEFGVRPYSGTFGTENMNLFQWYDQELADQCLTGLIYEHPNVPECDGSVSNWFDLCSPGCDERKFMRQIWEKSGIAN